MFGLAGDLVAEVEHDVRRVGQTGGLAEFAARGLQQILARLLFRFGKLLPRGQHLGVDAERGDARGHEVLVARFGHQGELTRHDGHDRFERHDVRVVADARARRVLGVVQQVAAEVVLQDVDERLFAAREKVLADAAARVVVAVVGYLFLVFFPAVAFHGVGQ